MIFYIIISIKLPPFLKRMWICLILSMGALQRLCWRGRNFVLRNHGINSHVPLNNKRLPVFPRIGNKNTSWLKENSFISVTWINYRKIPPFWIVSMTTMIHVSYMIKRGLGETNGDRQKIIATLCAKPSFKKEPTTWPPK